MYEALRVLHNLEVNEIRVAVANLILMYEALSY
jgi:hypothetical protein